MSESTFDIINDTPTEIWSSISAMFFRTKDLTNLVKALAEKGKPFDPSFLLKEREEIREEEKLLNEMYYLFSGWSPDQPANIYVELLENGQFKVDYDWIEWDDDYSESIDYIDHHQTHYYSHELFCKFVRIYHYCIQSDVSLSLCCSDQIQDLIFDLACQTKTGTIDLFELDFDCFARSMNMSRFTRFSPLIDKLYKFRLATRIKLEEIFQNLDRILVTTDRYDSNVINVELFMFYDEKYDLLLDEKSYFWMLFDVINLCIKHRQPLTIQFNSSQTLKLTKEMIICLRMNEIIKFSPLILELY